jgi:hypothetical protein
MIKCLIFLSLIFGSLCFEALAFEGSFSCGSDLKSLEIRRESGKDYFSFYFNKRLVAHRHLDVLMKDNLLSMTNHYDLDISLEEIALETYKGSLRGKLKGKMMVIDDLLCKGIL